MAQPRTLASPLNTLATPVTDLTHRQAVEAINTLPEVDRIVLSLLYVERLTPALAAIVMSRAEEEVVEIRERAIAVLGF